MPVIAASTGVATPEDLAAICALDAAILGRDDRCPRIGEAAGSCFVARLDGDLAGYAITFTNRSNEPMRRLCVRLGFLESGYVENLGPATPSYLRQVLRAPTPDRT
jgi:hypothetical protein